MSAHGTEFRTNCGNPNGLCVLHRSKVLVRGTIFYRKTAHQPVVRLFAPYAPRNLRTSSTQSPCRTVLDLTHFSRSTRTSFQKPIVLGVLTKGKGYRCIHMTYNAPMKCWQALPGRTHILYIYLGRVHTITQNNNTIRLNFAQNSNLAVAITVIRYHYRSQ